MQPELKDLKFLYSNNLPIEMLNLCTKENGCYFSENKKMILFTDKIFTEKFNKEYLKKLDKRKQLFGLNLYYKRRYWKKEHGDIFFGREIKLREYIDAAYEQLEILYEDGYEIDYNVWENELDYNIKLVATVDVFENLSKRDVFYYGFEKTLEEMKSKNYDTDLIKGIVEK